MIIKVLIVEDEKPVAEHLVRLLKESNYEIEILQITDSLESTLDWINQNPMPDLIFLDIQLSDGLSFELFRYTKIDCPVIFTTAYEEYAIKAFKVNSIDYLLKPIKQEELDFSLDKYLKQTKRQAPKQGMSWRVEQMYKMLNTKNKTRFVVNVGLHIRLIETKNIRFFYSKGKSTFLYDQHGKSYDVNFSLDQLEYLIDPTMFFRINRRYIINIHAIDDIIAYSSKRLKVIVKDADYDDMIVSRNRIKSFKEWLEK